LPFFPLASGLLTGKYSAGEAAPASSRLSAPWAADRFLTKPNVAKADVLKQFAAERGHTLLELAMSWLARQSPVASIIAGATMPAQIRANVDAVTWPLTSDDLAESDRLGPTEAA
jgi:aryl-alcohol dehydrogenase-like predicted oxidoreductase